MNFLDKGHYRTDDGKFVLSQFNNTMKLFNMENLNWIELTMTQAIVIHKMLNMRELTIPESRRLTIVDHTLSGNDFMDDSGKHHIFHDAGCLLYTSPSPRD